MYVNSGKNKDASKCLGLFHMYIVYTNVFAAIVRLDFLKTTINEIDILSEMYFGNKTIYQTKLLEKISLHHVKKYISN